MSNQNDFCISWFKKVLCRYALYIFYNKNWFDASLKNIIWCHNNRQKVHKSSKKSLSQKSFFAWFFSVFILKKKFRFYIVKYDYYALKNSLFLISPFDHKHEFEAACSARTLYDWSLSITFFRKQYYEAAISHLQYFK